MCMILSVCNQPDCFNVRMSSPSTSSTSFGKCTVSQPLCFCEVEATLRYSNTPRNPGCPFFGCPKYNNEGLPFCKFFKWVDGTLDIEQEVHQIKIELLRKDEELKRILDDFQQREIKFRKRADAIEKMLSNILEEVQKKDLVLLKQEAENRRSRTLLHLYWAVAIVVSCYILLSNQA
ncbi:uncharacterized protein LOC122308924 [Carya illinoinensis]|nr:uncharacterized protein LOC122308924 [Carya illinoinensis]